MSDLLRPIQLYAPGPLDEAQLIERLRLTLVSAGCALAMAPALVLVLGILTVLSVPLAASTPR